eukprot:CAMPEP_0172775518 /NCGR_PEP_ID=MMETSP1074-20121228/198113_1 /TAXON_ID=2916 /ORGANISM="Ceratium fusus, Strain PA161109" /LENGTH=189 /DNA_ID=CAMNT_0013612145 /DNA_START=468 /DNA_END=1037 /DNA_ORIENTATION=+
MSSMRLLNYVTPSIFIPALSQELSRARQHPWLARVMSMSGFLLVRVIYGIIGFEAFMIKFKEASICLNESSLEAYICSLAFLNQMLGIVQINPLLQTRMFRYLFGGEDGMRSDRELRVQHVWCAMLGRKIWQISKTRTGGHMWFVSVMLAYTDVDFQRLTLNERQFHKDQLPSPRIRKKKNNILHHEHD